MEEWQKAIFEAIENNDAARLAQVLDFIAKIYQASFEIKISLAGIGINFINKKNEHGNTPLYVAAEKGDK